MSLPLSGRLSGQVPFSLSYWSLSWWFARRAFLGSWRQENNESSENRRIAHFAGLRHCISAAVSEPGGHYCSGLYADVRGGCHSLEYLFGLHRLHRPRPCCLLRHGAYVMAILCEDWHIPAGYAPFSLIPLGGLVAALFAVPLGIIALRTRRHTFIVITIAFFFIFQLLAYNLRGITNGSAGLSLPIPTWSGDFYNEPFYYTTLRSEEHTSE